MSNMLTNRDFGRPASQQASVMRGLRLRVTAVDRAETTLYGGIAR